MKRILVVSDCPTLNTGYARVGRFVATTLQHNGYRVRYLPSNATVEDSNRTFDFETEKFDPSDRYNTRRIQDVLLSFKPSIVLVFGEFQYVGYIGSTCRKLNIQSLYYMPVEGEGYPPHWVYLNGGNIDFKRTIMQFHHIVAYSKFGSRNINNLLPGIVTDVIPHAVDTNTFKPLDKRKCRDQLFPQLDKPFIVGGVYRNMRRKGIDTYFMALEQAIKRETDRKIYGFLITDHRDPQGYNLDTLISRHNLKGRVILHPVTGGKEGPEDHQLCEIYNSFDVHLCPFRAEGWGLNILEGAACGVPTICTNYASPKEYGKDVFNFVDPAWFEPFSNITCEWAVLNPEDVANKLVDVYTRGDSSDVDAVKMAQKYSEEDVSKQWVKLIKDIDLPDMADVEETTEQSSILDSYVDALQ
jgi:glycosyltransferase involved in cell wall biosynthesis